MAAPAVGPQHPVVYLLPSRPWLYSLRAGSLQAVPDEAVDEVCRDVDFVWLQGIWELGPAGRLHDLADPGRLEHFRACLPGEFSEEDCIGSPYAVTRYVPNPDVARSDEELAAFRARLRARGVGLLLDFVPNHTARDSPWVEEPGIHVPDRDGRQQPAFGRDPYSGDWTDTAQLNYWSDACRARMMDSFAAVAERCDGVRVDMAMLCCNTVFERTWGAHLRSRGFREPQEEFWTGAVRLARERNADFFILAECYEYDEIFPSGTGRELLRLGFDAVYDKVTYDRLTERHLDRLRAHLFGNALLEEGRLCHFVENHDEERAARHLGTEVAGAAAVAALTLPGPRLVMWGQELGRRNRLAVHLRRSLAEQPHPALTQLHRRLLAALPRCRGCWRPLGACGEGSWRLLAWGWSTQPGGSDAAQVAVVAVNYSDAEAWVHLEVAPLFAGLPRPSDGLFILQDVLTLERYERLAGDLLGGDGLVVGLRPYQAHLFLSPPDCPA